ncbi:MAG: vWA domain-containing protein [Actinomycetota bacterium]
MVAVLVAVVAAAGCGGNNRAEVASTDDAAAAEPTGGGESGDDSYAYGEEDDGAAARTLALESGGGVDGTVRDAVASEFAPAPISTSLNAGSVDDNQRWEDYLIYREDLLASGIDVHDVDITNRYVVRVVDEQGRSVLGARVELRRGGEVLATRTTYADGRVLLFPPRPSGQDVAPQYDVIVRKGDGVAEATLDPETRSLEITLKTDRSEEAVPLDVVFLIDATGSMGDEIEQLKANMVSVAEQIDGLAPRPDVRFAMTVYRDRGDEFVTRNSDFTADVAAFTTQLRDVVANGGGDTPESLNAGLHDALAVPQWRAGAIQLVFLVADAAPHLDYDDDADYAVEMDRAAQRGVKIHPIASSGLDNQGEYVMRQLAQYTTGRFNFLTYGADGVSPGDATTHHVDDYSVLSLDELVVQLVSDELAALAVAPEVPVP